MARTATNPQTGERVQFIDGVWKPIPKATASDRVKNAITSKAKEVKEPVDFDFGTMVRNIPESGQKYGEDIYQAVSNPMDTAEGLWKAGSGAAQKLWPGVQENEQYADAVGEHFANRYGGMDEFKTTLMNDPVGMLGDAAGVLGGIGMVPKLGKVGQLGSMIDPLNMAVAGGSKAIMNMPGMSKAPSSLYQSSAKFGNNVDRKAVTDTALDQGILPTDAGITKGRAVLDDLDAKIDDMIATSVNTGETIPRNKLYKYVDEVKKDVGGAKVGAAADLKRVDKVVGDFEQHMKSIGAENLTAADVQKFKQDIYRGINWQAKQGRGSLAKNKTKKGLAKAAKEELENIMPEIKGINLQTGDMIALMDAIDAPAKRIANRDVTGLGFTTKVIAGAMAGGPEGAILGGVFALADNPTVKARLALGLNKIKKQNISAAKKRVLTIELLRNEAQMEDSPE